MGEQCLTRAQLSALADALRGMHAITPESAGERASPINRWALGKIRQFKYHNWRIKLAKLAKPLTVSAPAREAHDLLQMWLRGADQAILLQPAPAVFSPADHNLANCLWDGERLRIVDFEFSGWSDRGFDLAEQTEHIQSRGTPDEAWEWFVGQLDLSPAERIRFQSAQRLLALFWVLKLWPRAAPTSDSRHERFVSQLGRAQRLCSRDSTVEQT